ncbi:hypothetical protein [Thiothrix unzii]|jgi:hypothetical protein|uniref:hypothetical protein n=1 Tax=Thiothrix unzii TaxID=111769 RepID=UPI002A36A702|nr:hypothetical protein [Thiothrix unzii]MDX9990350.1 hypothetical protein [Thiothrix unzii]
MVETGMINGVALQPQSDKLLQLPAPPNAQVMKFEAMMTQSDQAPSVENTTLLQVNDSDAANSSDLKNVLLNKIANLDSAYNKVVSGSQDLPKFNEFLAANLDKSSAKVNQTRSYPELPTGSIQDHGARYESIVERSQAYAAVSLEYQGMMANSLSRSKLFMANFQALTSAVRNLAEGFKTLFRSGG